MDFLNSFVRLKFLLVILSILLYPFASCYSLTISPLETVGILQTYDPESKSTLITTTSPNANLNNLTLATTLSMNNVVIRDNFDQDITLTNGTKIIWANGNSLTINALRHIIVGNQAQINSTGNGDLVLRADARGDTQGTFIYSPTPEPAVAMDGGGTVKVFYRPTSFSTPTDFTSTIKTNNFGLMKAFMLINSFADLQNMRLNLAGNYALARHIDAQGLIFAPIGNVTTPFTGHFDGQGYIINRLYVFQGNNNDVGLFGHTLNATVEDVGLINANIQGRFNVGALIGYNEVTEPSYFQGSVRRTFVMGTIGGYSAVGGLIGYDNNGSISESFADGNVSCTGFENSNYGGGLVGLLRGSIINSVSKSKVNRTLPASKLGGLYGEDFLDINVVNSYVAGAIQGPDLGSGAVIGYHSRGSFFNIFWDKDVTGRANPAGNLTTQLTGINGLETTDMYKKATYLNAGWDFANVWGIEEGNYPYLLWTKRTPPWTSIQNSVTKIDKIIG